MDDETKKPKKKPGRKEGTGQYTAYLPQVATKPDMVTRARDVANRRYQGSIGALIREALQEKLDHIRQEESRGTGNEYDPDNFHD